MAALVALSIQAPANEPPQEAHALDAEPYWYASLDAVGETKLNGLRLPKAHNTYQKQRWAGLSEALQHTNVVELDVWPMASRRDLYVNHSWPRNSNNCRSSNNRQDGAFSDCLRNLTEWSDAHPGHPVVILNVDFKAAWAGMEGRFDELLRVNFGERLYEPDEFRGEYQGVYDAATIGEWPSVNELRGRFIVLLTGGPFWSHNRHLRRYLDERNAQGLHQAAAFVCPNVSSRADLAFGEDRPSGIGSKWKDVACVNHQQSDLDDLATSSEPWRKLLVLGFGYGPSAVGTAWTNGVGIVAVDDFDTPSALGMVGLQL